MKKHLRAAAALLTAAMLASASLAAPAEEGIALPEPAPAAANMILGESNSSETQDITLYFSTDGSTYLSSATYAIPIEKNQTMIESALEQLFSPRFTGGALGTASTDVQLVGVEYGCGVATVNLNVNTSAQLSDQNELLRSASIANTLLGIEGVKAVNILTGSRSDAVSNLPLGTITQQYEGVSALHAQLQSEEDLFLQGGSGVIRRSVTLYYPSSNGYFLPEVRSLQFESEDYASVILGALKAVPEQQAQTFSPIPEGDDLFSSKPMLRVNQLGQRILDLHFSAMLSNYLAFSGVQPWQFYGSIVLSMCTFLPELDGVCMYIDGAPVSECAIGERIISFTGGVMRRSDFSAGIGSSVALYFTGEDGALRRVDCAVSEATAASARALLTTMVSAAAPAGMTSVFPEDVYADDILGVSVSSGIATVNLSGSFYTRCQGMTAAQERRLVYAMVNALCELRDIGAVSFLVEGMAVETLCSDIYLRTPLLPDPGLG